MMLEIACFNEESAVLAANAGADRIELCENYFLGGITPKRQIIKTVRQKIDIPLYVMIRPREGNFVYTESELQQMETQIGLCKDLNCDGLVFGILTSDNKVDVQSCKRLVELAFPLLCTFHRAFDEAADPQEALHDIISCGFKRLLTSGQASSALQGAELIRTLQTIAGSSLIVMPGGGVRSENIKELKKLTDCKEFHSSAITGKNIIVDPGEIQTLKLALL